MIVRIGNNWNVISKGQLVTQLVLSVLRSRVCKEFDLILVGAQKGMWARAGTLMLSQSVIGLAILNTLQSDDVILRKMAMQDYSHDTS